MQNSVGQILRMLGLIMVGVLVMPLAPASIMRAQESGIYPKITPQNARALKEVRRIGHGYPIQVRWSPDGRWLAVASTAGIYVIDATKNGDTPRALDESLEPIETVVFSRDSKTLHAAGSSGKVYRWTVEGWKALPSFNLKGDARFFVINFLEVGDDGKTLLVAASDGRNGVAELLDLKTGKVQVTIRDPGHVFEISQLLLTPDGTQLFMVTLDWRIWQWDIATNQAVRVFRTVSAGDANEFLTAAYDPALQRLYTTGSRALKSRSLNTAAADLLTPAEGATFRSAAYSRDQRRVLLLESDKETGGNWRVSVAELATGKVERTTPIQAAEIMNLALSEDMRRIALYAPDRGIEIRDLTSGEVVNTYPWLNFFNGTLAASPDGTLLVTAGDDGQVRLWETPSLKLLGTLGQLDIIHAILFSPDGRWLAINGSRMGKQTQGIEYISLYDARTRAFTGELSVRSDHFQAMIFSPHGDTLIAGDNSGTLYFWDVPTRELLTARVVVSNITLLPVGFLADQNRFLVGTNDAILIYQLDPRDPVGLFTRGSYVAYRPRAFTVNRDGTRVFITSATGKLELWAGSGVVPMASADLGAVVRLGLNPDQTLVLTYSADRSLTLLTTDSLKKTATLPLTEYLNDVAFSGDGSLVLAMSGNGQLWVYAVGDAKQ